MAKVKAVRRGRPVIAEDERRVRLSTSVDPGTMKSLSGLGVGLSDGQIIDALVSEAVTGVRIFHIREIYGEVELSRLGRVLRVFAKDKGLMNVVIEIEGYLKKEFPAENRISWA